MGHELFSCICCPSKLEVEMPHYQLSIHEKFNTKWKNLKYKRFAYIELAKNKTFSSKIFDMAFSAHPLDNHESLEDNLIQIEFQVSYFQYIIQYGYCNNS